MSDMFSHRFICAGCCKIVESDREATMCIECEAGGGNEEQAKAPATNFFCSQCKYESSWPFSVCGKCGAYGYCLDKRLPRDGRPALSVSLPETKHTIPMPECKPPKPDNSHYTKGGIEPWTYIQANNLNFFEGSVVKYITRWRHKNGIEDLRKARVYIDELIRQEESK